MRTNGRSEGLWRSDAFVRRARHLHAVDVVVLGVRGSTGRRSFVDHLRSTVFVGTLKTDGSFMSFHQPRTPASTRPAI